VKIYDIPKKSTRQGNLSSFLQSQKTSTVFCEEKARLLARYNLHLEAFHQKCKYGKKILSRLHYKNNYVKITFQARLSFRLKFRSEENDKKLF
jgi:hypothetical protein